MALPTEKLALISNRQEEERLYHLEGTISETSHSSAFSTVLQMLLKSEVLYEVGGLCEKSCRL
jgi:hypothetical protein